MDFATISNILEKMEGTSSRLALTDYLVSLFLQTPSELIDKVIYLIQGKLAPDYEGVELGVAEKMVIRAISTSSGKQVGEVQMLYRKTGDLGDTVAETMLSKTQTSLLTEPMTVERVYSTMQAIAKATGSGSQESKLRLLMSLLNESTPTQARYIVKFVLGQLRLGIADYTVLDAIAVAFTKDKGNRTVLENAYNVSSDLGAVAKLVASKGLRGLKSIKITIFRPIRPMLAERIRSADEALTRANGNAAVEYKLDGERIQIHKQADRVELFSRSLEKISHHYPDVVDAARSLKAGEAIVEGEVVAINADTGEYLPFQELMHRRRKHGIEQAMANYPVIINLFDVLYLNGDSKVNEKYLVRRKLLSSLTRSTGERRLRLIDQFRATSQDDIERIMAKAIENGCEGVMVKQVDSAYRAGAREYAWMKLKREYRGELVDSLDLVVVGALFGRGRRAGKYGALLVAVFDRDLDLFRSVSKVGTGFTDEQLEKFYADLEQHVMKHRHARVDSRMEMDVWFEPRIVIEVIASEITLSPSHSAAEGVVRKNFGLALRFPKFTGRIRDDKEPEDATSTLELVEMYRKQLKASSDSR